MKDLQYGFTVVKILVKLLTLVKSLMHVLLLYNIHILD